MAEKKHKFSSEQLYFERNNSLGYTSNKLL